MLLRVTNHSPTQVTTELPAKMFIKRVCFVSSGSPLACMLRDPSVHWNNKPLADCSDSGLCGLIDWGRLLTDSYKGSKQHGRSYILPSHSAFP